MSFREYMGDRINNLLLRVVGIAVLSLFLYLTGTEPGIIAIVVLIWVIVLIVSIAAAFQKERNYLSELQAVMDNLDEKYLFCECVPRPKRIYDRRVFELLRRSGKSMIEKVSAAQQEQKEYQEYIQSWVHEVKVPITTIQLTCRNNKSEVTTKIAAQIGQLEEHVERALYYARMGSVEKDFIVSRHDLSDIVTETIGKYKTLLIQNGMKIETQGLDREVYTDNKWVEFMLGQMLSNAARYRSVDPLIRIEAHDLGKLVCLSITDNGIGIPDHELSRIFERGFTGSNGRSRGGSTGMGLYICKRLAKELQIEMKAKSKEAEFTTISLTFPSREILT